WAFAATSTMLKPAPITQAAGSSVPNDGANAVAVNPAATMTRPSRTGPRLPYRDDSQPDDVRRTVALSDTPRMTSPSSPLSSPRRDLIAGSPATHVPSTVPNP